MHRIKLRRDSSTLSRRNIKGRPFGVGFGCLPQSLKKGTPSMDSKKTGLVTLWVVGDGN
jgi:hypothetical protein